MICNLRISPPAQKRSTLLGLKLAYQPDVAFGATPILALPARSAVGCNQTITLLLRCEIRDKVAFIEGKDKLGFRHGFPGPGKARFKASVCAGSDRAFYIPQVKISA